MPNKFNKLAGENNNYIDKNSSQVTHKTNKSIKLSEPTNQIFDSLKQGELLEEVLMVSLKNKQDTDQNECLQEFTDLINSANAKIVATLEFNLKQINSKYFISKGILETIEQQLQLQEVEAIIINCRLSPGQEKNLQKYLQVKVIDRIRLILDIFAQRASSYEGKLQVELAQLEHMSTRLIRGWTHLERQKGGIGLRGPGETQLESDRRMIAKKIVSIKQRLTKISKQRQLSRNKRNKSDQKIVAIVGYTNAGKSLLFNQLTNAYLLSEDKLFATLDATLRAAHIKGAGKYIFVDTVGFIKNLPHELIDAFKSTLEETLEASLLIHLIDYADPARKNKEQDVDKILVEIGANFIPTLKVFNKIDIVNQQLTQKADEKNKLSYIEPHIEYQTDSRLSNKHSRTIYISAYKNQGLELLKESIAAIFQNEYLHLQLTLKPNLDGKLRAELFKLGDILQEHYDIHGRNIIKIHITDQAWQNLNKTEIESYQRLS